MRVVADEGTGQMIGEKIEENQSGMTEERMNAVLGRSAEAAAEASEAAGDDAAAKGIVEAGVEAEPEAAREAGDAAGAGNAAEADLPRAAMEDSQGGVADAAGAAAAEGVADAAKAEEKPFEVGIASGVQYRQDTRYEVDGDAEVFVKTGSMGTTLLRGSILDLSATGCFIQTMARVMIKPGTVVQLIFSIYGTTFRIDAASRFARMRVGVGFRFLEMDEPTHKRLHAVLEDIRSKLIEEDPSGVGKVIDRTVLE